MSTCQESIFNAQQDLDVAKNKSGIYIEELAITKVKKQEENKYQMEEAERRVELDKAKMALNASQELDEIKLAIDHETEQRKLLAARFETEKKTTADRLLLEQKAKEQEFAQLKAELKIKDESYTPNVLKSMVLETSKDIYKSLNIRDMRVVNMGGGEGGGDQAGQLLGQMIGSYKSISDSMTN